MAGNKITLERYPHLGWYDARHENQRQLMRDTGSREVIMVLADHLFYPVVLNLPQVEKSRREMVARSELRSQFPLTHQHAVTLYSENGVDLAIVCDTSLIRTEERIARSSEFHPVAVVSNAIAWLIGQVQNLKAGHQSHYRGGVEIEVKRSEDGKFQLLHWSPIFEELSPLDNLNPAKPLPDFSHTLEKRPSFLSRLPKGNQMVATLAIVIICAVASFGLNLYSSKLINDASKRNIEALWSGAFPGEKAPADPVGILLSRIRSATGATVGGIEPYTLLNTISFAFYDMQGINLRETVFEDGKIELVGNSISLTSVDNLMEKLQQLDAPFTWRLIRADNTQNGVEFRITGGPA